MDFNQNVKRSTGLSVGRLGISSSYGAPAKAFEEAFEKGCNYFTWGTSIRGRSPEMAKAIQTIIKKGQRDKLVLSNLTYAHSGLLTEFFLKKGLKELGTDYADVLLLGYFNKRPSQRILDNALKLKEKGLVRHLGITSHNRKLFAQLKAEGLFEVFHFRYNAAHRGAETDIFPFFSSQEKPGMVSFTATRWGALLRAKNMPQGEEPLSAIDCYRFVLSQPMVDVCMMGTKTIEQMRENLQILGKKPMTGDELTRVRKIGDYLHNKKAF